MIHSKRLVVALVCMTLTAGLAGIVPSPARADAPETVTLDVAAIRSTALAGNPVTIGWGTGKSYTLVLTPTQVFASDATHTLVNADFTESPGVAPTVLTYKGFVQGQESTTDARIAITTTWVNGYVLTSTGWDFIEPLEYPSPDGQHRVYNYYDPAQGVTPGTHLDLTTPGTPPPEPEGGGEVVCVLNISPLLCPNQPPAVPPQPSGPSSGVVGQSLQFCTQGTSDPEGQAVSIIFNWGDGTSSSPIGASAGQTVCASHSYSLAAAYGVKARARDSQGAESAESAAWTVTITSNQAPNQASRPAGPSTTNTALTETYCTSATDPEGHQVKYSFDWGDGSALQETGFGSSGWNGCLSHRWTTAGSYNVATRATDSLGAVGAWSLPFTVVVSTFQANRAPNTPSQPSGASNLVRGQSASYSTSATDIDGNQVRYEFNWGDGSMTETTSFGNSGSNGALSHSFSSLGTFCVSARTHDNGAPTMSSGWSSCKNVQVVNQVPGQAATPSGTTSFASGSTQTYTTSATDPDGEALEYRFEWGDGTTSAWGAAAQAHTFGHGQFVIRAQARDPQGSTGPWSTGLLVVGNIAPAQPSQPSGPRYGLQNHQYQLGVRGTDPDGDPITYRLYGPNGVTGDSAQVASGDANWAWMSYSTTGTSMTTQAKGIDSFGAEGLGGSFHSVKIKATRMTIRIAAYFDQSWNDRYGVDATNRVGAIMNQVNGVTARASGSIGANPDNDYEVAFTTGMASQSPTSNDCQTWVETYRARMARQSSTHRELNVGFSHRAWWTDPSTGQNTVRGCAFQDGYADSGWMYSVATTRTQSGGTETDANAILLWAHELGHQIYARHEDARCWSGGATHQHCTVMASGVSWMHTHNEWDANEVSSIRANMDVDSQFGRSVDPTIPGLTVSTSGRTVTVTISPMDYDDSYLHHWIDWGDGSGQWTAWLTTATTPAVSHLYGSGGCKTFTVWSQDMRETWGWGQPWTVCV